MDDNYFDSLLKSSHHYRSTVKKKLKAGEVTFGTDHDLKMTVAELKRILKASSNSVDIPTFEFQKSYIIKTSSNFDIVIYLLTGFPVKN